MTDDRERATLQVDDKEAGESEPSQKEIAQRALAMKKDGAATTHPENTPTADDGLNPTPRPDYPPSGAFDAEGHKPVLERSRKER